MSTGMGERKEEDIFHDKGTPGLGYQFTQDKTNI